MRQRWRKSHEVFECFECHSFSLTRCNYGTSLPGGQAEEYSWVCDGGKGSSTRIASAFQWSITQVGTDLRREDAILMSTLCAAYSYWICHWGFVVQVPGSKLLSEGLYVGGSFEGAQARAFSMPGVTMLGGSWWFGAWACDCSEAWVEEGEGSSLRIRFFLNHIQWRQGSKRFKEPCCSVPESPSWTDLGHPWTHG